METLHNFGHMYLTESNKHISTVELLHEESFFVQSTIEQSLPEYASKHLHLHGLVEVWMPKFLHGGHPIEPVNGSLVVIVCKLFLHKPSPLLHLNYEKILKKLYSFKY